MACTFGISFSTRFSRGSDCTPLFHENANEITTVNGHGSDFRRLLRVFVVSVSECILMCRSAATDASSPCAHDHNTNQWTIGTKGKPVWTISEIQCHAHKHAVSNKDVVIVLFMSKQSTVGKELSSVLLTHFGTVTRVLEHIVLLVLAHLSYKLCGVSGPVLHIKTREQPNLASRNRLSLLNDGSRSKARVRFKMSTLENAAAGADVAVVVNAAASQNRSIANNDVVANEHGTREAAVCGLHAVDNRTVLNVTFGANRNGVAISLHNGAVPNSGARGDLNVSAHSRVGGNIHGGINNGRLAVHGKNWSMTRV